MKKRKQRINEIEMQYVIELASNINFLILASIRVFAQGIASFLTLIIFFIIEVQQQGLLMDFVALLFGATSIWIGHKATANLSLIFRRPATITRVSAACVVLCHIVV